MLIERVDIAVIPGREAEFEGAMEGACSLLAGALGCASVSLARGVERPSNYMLLIGWGNLADHDAFTRTAEFQAFREFAGPYFSGRPTMEHFQPIHPPA